MLGIATLQLLVSRTYLSEWVLDVGLQIFTCKQRLLKLG
jgi:hypothetical protein